MKHLRKFNEDIDDNNNDNEMLLSDSGEIHDSLLYDYGLGSDLGAYQNMKYNLEVGMDELPEEARSLFNEIDSTVSQVAPELRNKILRLYTVLTGDNSLNENFAFDPKNVTKDQLDRLAKSLKTICELYKDECEGGSVHPSEDFDDGSELKELANGVQDVRIKSILNNMAQCCEAECDGSAEHLCDWINDDDCHYMCDFMGIDRMEF